MEYYFQQDILGNVTAVTDASGNLMESYTYDAYGAVTAKNASGTVLTTAPLSPFLFTGHKYSHETGLYLTPYRAYSPELGRWLQRDPIRENGGLNIYMYAGNNPVKFIDPLGLSLMSRLSPGQITNRSNRTVRGVDITNKKAIDVGPVSKKGGSGRKKKKPNHLKF